MYIYCAVLYLLTLTIPLFLLYSTSPVSQYLFSSLVTLFLPLPLFPIPFFLCLLSLPFPFKSFFAHARQLPLIFSRPWSLLPLLPANFSHHRAFSYHQPLVFFLPGEAFLLSCRDNTEKVLSFLRESLWRKSLHINRSFARVWASSFINLADPNCCFKAFTRVLELFFLSLSGLCCNNCF